MVVEQNNQARMAATVLGAISVLLGLGVIAWNFYRGDGLHGGGLIGIALGLVAIVAVRAGGRTTS